LNAANLSKEEVTIELERVKEGLRGALSTKESTAKVRASIFFIFLVFIIIIFFCAPTSDNLSRNAKPLFRKQFL